MKNISRKHTAYQQAKMTYTAWKETQAETDHKPMHPLKLPQFLYHRFNQNYYEYLKSEKIQFGISAVRTHL